MVEVAYFAGLFDGEGCITFQRRKGIPSSLHIAVWNTNRSVLDLLQDRYGGGVTSKKVKEGRLFQWGWQATGEVGVAFLREVYPHLIIKKEQAEIAFKYQETMGHGRTNKGIPKGLAELRELLAKQLTFLKKADFPGASVSRASCYVDVEALFDEIDAL